MRARSSVMKNVDSSNGLMKHRTKNQAKIQLLRCVWLIRKGSQLISRAR